jgi:hypothetical protein
MMPFFFFLFLRYWNITLTLMTHSDAFPREIFVCRNAYIDLFLDILITSLSDRFSWPIWVVHLLVFNVNIVEEYVIFREFSHVIRVLVREKRVWRHVRRCFVCFRWHKECCTHERNSADSYSFYSLQ